MFIFNLLQNCTNLAARFLDVETLIGGEARDNVTNHCCNRKTPIVELVTIKKHYQDIARVFKKNSFR